MRIITIGDLHGSPVWKQIQPEEWDRMVFIGDYVDSGDFTRDEIILNLMEIIDLKKKLPDKIVLLMGNHDLAYFYGGHGRHYCSGFKMSMLSALYSLFTSNRNLFQAASQVGNHLWTHAGVVQRWYDTYIQEQVKPTDENLAYTFNRLFREYFQPLFHVSALRGGLYEDGGIFWAHRAETSDDPMHGYHQIVGHTKTRSGIMVTGDPSGETSVTYVDCLDTNVEFYQLDLRNDYVQRLPCRNI
ncbi:MAG TPA: metallophosphoesterase [Bacteroidales bacterium]|nr:metallophosphoesterase [Bacteroidales bacterium]